MHGEKNDRGGGAIKAPPPPMGLGLNLISLTLIRLACFWRLERLGGGAIMAPLEISAVDRAIAAEISTMVVCDVIYKIVYLDFPKYFYFILY